MRGVSSIFTFAVSRSCSGQMVVHSDLSLALPGREPADSVESSRQVQTSEGREIPLALWVENVQSGPANIGHYPFDGLLQQGVSVQVSLGILHRASNRSRLSGFSDLLHIRKVDLDLTEDQVMYVHGRDPKVAVLVQRVEDGAVRGSRLRSGERRSTPIPRSWGTLATAWPERSLRLSSALKRVTRERAAPQCFLHQHESMCGRGFLGRVWPK